MPRTRARAHTAKRVVFSGQSRNLFPTSPGSLTYPHVLMRGRGVPWSNIAVNGYSWAWLTIDAGNVGHDDDIAEQITLGSSVHVWLQGGEASFVDRTGAQSYADLTAYANLYRGLGYASITVLTSPSSDLLIALNGSGWETHRQDYNTLVRANSAGFEHVVDIDVPPVAYYTGNPLWTDDPHQNAEGSRQIAALCASTMDAVLA